MAGTNNGSVGRGFTEGELKFASFWVRNRMQVKSGVTIGLIAANLGFWGYVLWGVLDAYAISYPRESRIIAHIADDQLTLDALNADRPETVRASQVSVLQGTDGRFDMVVDLENPNAQWWADFDYRFNLSGEQTPRKVGFILPGSRTTITDLGYRPKGRGGAVAEFVVETVRWHRVDPAVVGSSYTDYALGRFNVAFEKIAYDNGFVLGTKQISRTSFDVVNRGAYGYWILDVVVKLFRGTTLVGINRISLPRIVPGETRHIDLDWFDRISGVTKTEVIPIVNLLDPTAFLPTGQF